MKPPAHSRESGYAMLLIFLMAALVAITLYRSMPSIAFEAERDQEQLLIDRGEQYKRAIQLYYRKTGRYPAKVEDLENTGGIRFLRKKYVDPLTGKAEWRLIHVGPGGVFTDSLTQKSNATTQKKDPASVNTFITELKPIGGDSGAPSGPVNIGMRRRPSEGGGDSLDPAFPTLPTNDPQILGEAPNGGHEMPSPGAGTQVGQGFAANAGGLGGTDPNTVGNQQAGLNSGSDIRPGQAGAPNAGANMIRNLLTSPRPGGAPPGFGGNGTDQFGNPLTPPSTNAFGNSQSVQPGGSSLNSNGGGGFGGGTATGGFGQQVTGNLGGQTIGGGIAGVASTASGVGIKLYKERNKYKEWEFIYDYGKDLAGRQNLPTQNQNANANANANQNGPNVPSQTSTSTNSNAFPVQPVPAPPPPPVPVPQPAAPEPEQPVEGDPIN